MTVAELPAQVGSDSAMPDRTPPQDVAAEQSVLGAMMLSKDAIADVVETVRVDDFYRPAHQSIFGVVTDLFGRGEPADAVTVANALTRAGDLARVGSAAYLHTLVAGVPTAANAAYYAQIVRDAAILRRLVTAGTRIVQWGYSGEGDVDQVVDRAQAEVFDVTSRRSGEDYLPLAQIMDGAITEIEGIASRSGEMVGVPTGFADLDRLTNGLHPGQLIILAARPAIGKALALDTPIPTPDGWTTMGEVRVGDLVLGGDGRPTRVTARTDVMLERDCYLVEFCDGARIVADAQHQWAVGGWRAPVGRDPGPPRLVATTAEIARRMAEDGQIAVVGVANARPLELPSRELPVPPYALGVWLAEAVADSAPPGDTRREIAMHIEAAVDDIAAARHEADAVLASPRIPAEYLRAAASQRRSLLAGILDRLGVVADTGAVVARIDSRRLARDLYELLVSLGLRVDVRGEPARSVAGPACTALVFETTDEVFRCEELRLLHKKLIADTPADRDRRLITAVTPIPSVPVRCIEVDSADHLFLAGRAMIPTHNSTLGLDIARSASVRNGLPSVIFSLEMSRNEIVMRLLSAEAQIPLHHMRSGNMGDAEWRKIAARHGVLHEAPLFVDDSPNMTMTEIRAKCRRLRQRHDLRLVVLDYMQLMTSGKKVESRQQEVSEFSRSLKLLAKELEVPVVAISQLNRGPESRNDKKPMLSDLRESGCLTAETRVVRADSGCETTLGELHASGARNVPVWSLDDSLRYRARTLTHVFPTGRREVFRLRTASGRVLHATANHPLLTFEGWKAVAQLPPGCRIATPRHLPDPLSPNSMDRFEVMLLAHLLGAGSMLRRANACCLGRDLDSVAAVRKAAYSRFGVDAISKREDPEESWTTYFPTPRGAGVWLRNPISQWLADLGLRGRENHKVFVPAPVFRLPKEQVALFLQHLWAACGQIRILPSQLGGSVFLTTSSRRLAEDVARLLLRFGVTARVAGLRSAGDAAGFRVTIAGAGDQQVFLRRVGGFGSNAEAARRLLAVLDAVSTNTGVDAVPREVWERVREVIADGGMTHGEFQAVVAARRTDGGEPAVEASAGRERIAWVADALDDSQLDLVATNDVHWDEVVEVESIGMRDVFDATVPGTHNFIADGVAVHNSLEQDADMVVLIHREDAYDRDSARIGEADFIVAKHRNGPTDTVTVAFQGHYSRFVDMARE